LKRKTYFIETDWPERTLDYVRNRLHRGYVRGSHVLALFARAEEHVRLSRALHIVRLYFFPSLFLFCAANSFFVLLCFKNLFVVEISSETLNTWTLFRKLLQEKVPEERARFCLARSHFTLYTRTLVFISFLVFVFCAAAHVLFLSKSSF
jgi:hypothetical protein